MKNYSAFLQDLSTLISYKSTYSCEKEGAPFGEEIAKALNYFLSLGKKFGFETINYDGYAGEISMGSGKEIGIMGHIDVVPVGDGWNTNPFTLTKKDGVFFGRGLMDDKAPLLLCLYALKQLKEENIPFNKKLRLFVGCDEESGWRDLDYLKSKTNLPEYGFSPDGNFPLSYAEKGIAVIEFSIPLIKGLTYIKGGTVINAVCDCVKCKMDSVNLNLLNKYGLTFNDDFIESFGVASHGSCPEKGKNAIYPLFQYFSELGFVSDNILKLFNDGLNLSSLSSQQGKTTLSPDLIDIENGVIKLKCDCRFPAPYQIKDLLPYLDKVEIPYTVKEKHPSHMSEKDGFLVNSLLSSYNEVLKEKGEPIAQGGSTFARAFKKGVAFGPEFIGEDSSIHQANEHLSERSLLTLYKIYYKAIKNLIK